MQQHKQDLLTSKQFHISVPSLRLITSYLFDLGLYILIVMCHHSPEHRRRIISPRGCWEQVSAPSGAQFGGRFMFAWGHFRLRPSPKYQSQATGFFSFPSWILDRTGTAVYFSFMYSIISFIRLSIRFHDCSWMRAEIIRLVQIIGTCTSIPRINERDPTGDNMSQRRPKKYRMTRRVWRCFLSFLWIPMPIDKAKINLLEKKNHKVAHWFLIPHGQICYQTTRIHKTKIK